MRQTRIRALFPRARRIATTVALAIVFAAPAVLTLVAGLILSIASWLWNVLSLPFAQGANQVTIRKAGARTMAAPIEAAAEARACLPYARMSIASYDGLAPGLVPRGHRLDFRRNRRLLESDGWIYREQLFAMDVPGEKLLWQKMRDANLSCHVWSKDDNSEVVITFTGTFFRSVRDWLSNLRWVLPFRRVPELFTDQYSVVSQHVVTVFAERFLAHAERHPELQQARIVAAGHSLGGGLAQTFAYSLPIRKGLPRVSLVYAFNSSPVTGFYSIDEALRTHNIEKLSIQRVYERGEGLAPFRWLVRTCMWGASTRGIRDVRFHLNRSWSPIDKHGMRALVEGMEAL